MVAPSLADVVAARDAIRDAIRETPVWPSATLSHLAGRPVHLKVESLQRTGSFKLRGALARIASLGPTEARAGLVAASAGNHGQAVAWAARRAGIAATIFMPVDAPMAKIEATRGYGAETRLVGASFDEALAEARAHAERAGATFLHAFDDPVVIAGQGTLGLELHEQLPADAAIVLPVGGGGLAAGVAIVLSELRPGSEVWGVQAGACAPLAGGSTFGPTIADGIAVKRPGRLTEPIIRERLAGVLAVDDERIAEAILLLLERAKLVVEGAGAAPLAAVLAGLVPGDGPVCVVLAGGNIDASTLVSVTRHGLALAGRYLDIVVRLPDRPGQLARILELVGREQGNVVDITHHREGRDIGVLETKAEVTLEARDEAHCEQIVDALERAGYPVTRVL